MRPLRFGFVLDDWGIQVSGVPNNMYWPNLVMSHWGATQAYLYVAPLNSNYTLHEAIESGRIDEALSHNLDVLIVQLGYYDLAHSGDLDLGQADLDCKAIVTKCRAAKTKLLFMDYWRAIQVQNNLNGYELEAGRIVHDYVYGFTGSESDWNTDNVMAGTNLYWHDLLVKDGTSSDAHPWLSEDFWHPNNYGNTAVADVTGAALTPLIQDLWYENMVTYACIGDSWTAVGTSIDNRYHWTRIVGNALGAKMVCDAGTGGQTIEGLYNNTSRNLGDPNQVDWVLHYSPDMVFTTIGGNDTWGGYKSETEPRMRAVVERLIAGGVKKLLWSFYAQIHFDPIAQGVGMTVAQMKAEFELLRQMGHRIAADYPNFITFVSRNMENQLVDFTYHPEIYVDEFSGNTDDMHIHGAGWADFAPLLVEDFQSTYNALYTSKNLYNLHFKDKHEWLGRNSDGYPRLNVGNRVLSTPFTRKAGFELIR